MVFYLAHSVEVTREHDLIPS